MRRILLLASVAAILAACNNPAQVSKPQKPDLTAVNGTLAVAGEILVKYGGKVSLNSVRALSGTRALSSFGDAAWGSLVRVQVPAGQEAAYAARYTAQTGVEYAEPNYWVPTERDDVQTLSFALGKAGASAQAFTPTDPYFVNVPATDPFAYSDPGRGLNYTNVPYLWGLYRIKAPEAWNAGYTGQGVVVSIVDEGTDLNHPDLKDQLWTNPNPSDPNCPGTHGYNFVDDNADPSDTGGHGTHTAGTVGAAANNQGVVGVAPQAKLMILKALGYFGGTNYMLVRALKYAADCGSQVSSNSWGSSARSKAFLDILNYGTAKGTTYVFSAGNSYRSANPRSYPAGFSTEIQGVVAVGATQPNNFRVGFSSTGDYVTVAAPGTAIMSTVPVGQNPTDPYAFLQGTSMSCPHVSGVVALMYQAKPGIKPNQVKQILQDTANSVITGQLARPDYSVSGTQPAEKVAGSYGYGIVDALAATAAAKALP
jgi:subtilisin family serine protease